MKRMMTVLHTGLRGLGLFLFLMGAGEYLHADPPEATITSPSGPITIATNQTVGFMAASADSFGYDIYTVNSYSWSFGDGTTGAGASTSHVYAVAGTYSVTLTVSYSGKTCTRMDTNGNCTSYQTTTKTATASRVLTALAPPAIGSFSASATTVGAGKPVTLSWSTTNSTSLSISGVGVVTGTSVDVYPTATTSYVLTASNTVGSVSSSVTVTTYTVGVGISPGSASLKFGEVTVFSATVTPANQGVTWSATGGSLTGSTSTATTFTGTAAGTFTVKATSVEDATKSVSSSVTVAAVSVETPVPNPSTGQIFVGGTVTFTAIVSNAVNEGITWSVSGGGSINASGVFTASQQGTWTVTAKSQADPTKSSTASVKVMPLTVTITPPGTATVRSGQTQAFSAAVATGAGTPSQAVTWSVDGVLNGNATVGTITSAGIYTAPMTSADHTITATSVQDPDCFGNASVHVPGWALKWKKDILYAGTKEIAEVDTEGMHVTLVDHLGSPRFLVGPTGIVESEQKFLPFGEQLTDPVSAAKFAKGFTNHEQTDPSGLIYMQARFYAPWYGRFLSPDPKYDEHFEDTQGWNIYSYCENNPTMRIDPDGMDWIDKALGGAYSFLSNVPVTGSMMRLTAAATNQTVSGEHVSSVGDGKARWSQAGAATVGLAVDVGSVASGGGVAATIKNVAVQTGTGVALDTASGAFNGGAHADMSKPSGDGLDSHHAPPRGTGGVEPGKGPAIQMEPADHQRTTSYGSGAKAEAWRAEQQSLAKTDPRKMLAREAKDIRNAAKKGSGSATKYNGAIKKMLEYAKKVYNAVK